MGTNRRPGGWILDTLGNIFTLVDSLIYKEVAKQHPVPKREREHFLLQLRAYIRLVQSVHFQTKVGNGCILVFHCGFMSQCFGTWCLWEWVSILHVPCHRRKRVQINSNTISPYSDKKLWAFPPRPQKNEWMKKIQFLWGSFFPSLFCFPIPSSPLYLLNSIRSIDGESTLYDNYSKAIMLYIAVYNKKFVFYHSTE